MVTDFAKHRCNCPGARRIKKVSCEYAHRVQKFVSHLCQQGVISPEFNKHSLKMPSYSEKFQASLQCRGLASATIKGYMYAINKLLPLLGDKPEEYDALHIRQLVSKLARRTSCGEIKKLTTALKAYLRFLAIEKVCRPDLDTAIIPIAYWKLSSLPKYIVAEDMERVILSCDSNTQQGIRDRAIILLLARLGLRAGDVYNMKLNDIDWSEGTLHVCGKGRVEVQLPLPQEVGDALLSYIKDVRPVVTINEIFLCLKAPYRTFCSSSGISSIVSAALKRAGIKHAPSSGASLLRHSAATQMLRMGATLETVSAMLRHRSLDMTTYYAKVDIPRLTQIAQPWPEGAQC